MADTLGVAWANAGTVAFLQQDFGLEVRQAVHSDTQELYDLLYQRVLGRTPSDTGALQSALDGEVVTDPNSEDLISLYFQDAPQDDAWNRVYVAYQEGGVLGLSTYTNDPHEMIGKIQTDDLPLINAWIKGSVEQGLGNIASKATD